LLIAAAPLSTSAISPDQVTPENIAGGGVIKVEKSPIQNVSGIVGIAASVVRWIYVIFFIIAVMYVLFAAFAYLTENDDSEKMKVVHSRIKYAAIAIAIALLAIGLELIVKNFLTTGGGDSSGGTGGGDYWRVNQGNLPTESQNVRWTPFGGDKTPPTLPKEL
ncbi:MAG: hypothetical protein AAB832_00180, partial [Patescibacteria group bacterium]